MKSKSDKPRNFVVKNALQFSKSAGPHGKTEKAKRKLIKQVIVKNLKLEEE